MDFGSSEWSARSGFSCNSTDWTGPQGERRRARHSCQSGGRGLGRGEARHERQQGLLEPPLPRAAPLGAGSQRPCLPNEGGAHTQARANHILLGTVPILPPVAQDVNLVNFHVQNSEQKTTVPLARGCGRKEAECETESRYKPFGALLEAHAQDGFGLSLKGFPHFERPSH